MNRKGFSLVELAVVLVVIGLIIGMVMKGRQLIDGARVKNLASQYNKVNAGMNIFYERYGFVPGDGCDSATDTVAGCDQTRNGLIESGTGEVEDEAFWHLLISETNILADSDQESVFGTDWSVVQVSSENFLEADGDRRLICALDQLIDDGVETTGLVVTTNTTDPYSATTDCWSETDTNTVRMRIIP